MSLFKWSTPERRSTELGILPIIPNEIYLYLFEHIAPPTGRLTPEQLQVFTNLSRVCRFFANVCLPRIFEFLEFSGSIFRDDTPTWLRSDATYKTSRESVLCTQLAAKQPIALALAKTVRACHFIDWKLDDTGSWAARLFVSKYIAGMSHMTNIRELQFSNCFVDVEHWRAIATLASLEELSFDRCSFLRGPADADPEKRVKVKVSHLRVVDCNGLRQVVAAIDARCLCTLAMDFLVFDQVDWLSEAALTELRLCSQVFPVTTSDWYLERLPAFLMRAPQSLRAIELFLDVSLEITQDFFQRMFDDPAWRNLPVLRSLTLVVASFVKYLPEPVAVFSSILEGINLFTNLQSFALIDTITHEVSPAEIRRILHDKLGPSSSLRHTDVNGRVFRLVDGGWSEV